MRENRIDLTIYDTLSFSQNLRLLNADIDDTSILSLWAEIRDSSTDDLKEVLHQIIELRNNLAHSQKVEVSDLINLVPEIEKMIHEKGTLID